MAPLNNAHAVAEWLRGRVTGRLQTDSRRVGLGDAFIAWPGAAHDARRFVPQALQAGASAVLVEHNGVEAFGFADERVCAVVGLKALAGPIAAAFHGEPSRSLDLLAITGTNGKTSSAWWLAQLLSALQGPCALIGTLGMGHPARGGQPAAMTVTGLTTPDPVALQTQLREWADQGLRACAIEASSIGIEEQRLAGCRLRLAAFTNFTQDHLDYHGSMAAYWAAKARLFDWPDLPLAVVNTDDPHGERLAQALAKRAGLGLWTCGSRPLALAAPRLEVTRVEVMTDGQRITLVERDAHGSTGAPHTVTVPLVGSYNVANLMGVLACARALGHGLAEALAACARLSAVPGRMERVLGTQAGEPLVLVDYAHTPDALEQALAAVRPMAQRRQGRLLVVVGCGGDRDAGKRPLMAAAAQAGADRVVLTSDNPRSEDPYRILADMRAGLRGEDGVTVVVDRAEAITRAVAAATAQDVVLIAGKGHEDYQEIQGVKRPFSDQDQARAAWRQQQQRAGGVA